MEQDRIIASYLIRCGPEAIEARAHALAVEQSIEMPPAAVVDPWIRDTIIGRVASIAPQRSDGARSQWRVDLSLATETVDASPEQLLNMLFGNASLQSDVRLLDARLPPSLCDALPGPAFGIDGIRRLLGAGAHPLSCSALKPQGLPVEGLAALAATLARAGIDIIKDDHGIANQPFAPFAKRVPAIQAAIRQANRETGRQCLYAPHLSGGPASVMSQLRIAREAGVRCVLACPMLLGIGSFVDLIRRPGDLAVIAHPAMAGAGRIAAPLLLGRLFRLFGADATIFPNFGGRFSYDQRTCTAIARAARAPLGRHPACLPVPAGGMRVDRVDEMIATFGPDTMLLIGGNLLEAGDAMPERAAAFATRTRDAIRASPSAPSAPSATPDPAR